MSTVISHHRVWTHTTEKGCMPAWVITADTKTGNIDISSPGRINVYIKADEQAEFQLCYDQARAWLAEQEDQS